MHMDEEKLRFEKYKIENIIRRHDYFPFIFQLIKMTVQKGKLNELIENGKKKLVEK